MRGIEVRVFNLPEMELLEGGGELLDSVQQAVIDCLEDEGYPFGSGYSVWVFHDD